MKKPKDAKRKANKTIDEYVNEHIKKDPALKGRLQKIRKDYKKEFMKPKDAEDWEIDFRDKFYTQLIDDYGDEHLYDHIISWFRTLLAKERARTVKEIESWLEGRTMEETTLGWNTFVKKLLEGGNA